MKNVNSCMHFAIKKWPDYIITSQYWYVVCICKLLYLHDIPVKVLQCCLQFESFGFSYFVHLSGEVMYVMSWMTFVAGWVLATRGSQASRLAVWRTTRTEVVGRLWKQEAKGKQIKGLKSGLRLPSKGALLVDLWYNVYFTIWNTGGRVWKVTRGLLALWARVQSDFRLGSTVHISSQRVHCRRALGG